MDVVAGAVLVLADASWGHMGGWGWPGGLVMVGWWLLIAGAIIAAVRFGASGRSTAPGRRSAREILDERFARGEIDRAEYRERLEVLEQGS